MSNIPNNKRKGDQLTAEEWNNAAQVINELDAKAYVKPQQGIPKSDLHEDVQESLDNAYKKPDTGIPASDIEEGVIPDISTKQDVINDLDAIRNNASSGAQVAQNYLKEGPTSSETTTPDFDAYRDTIHSKAQTLSSTQKGQVRENIGAQETLISGTNIKTINNESILGNGNIVIPKGDKGDPGTDGYNPFKGWYTSSSNLPSNPVVGDYAYVKGAESTEPAAIYECTTEGTWSNSSRTADTSNVQTFASGEEVNETPIDDSHLVNPADGALPLATDVKQQVEAADKQIIEGVYLNLSYASVLSPTWGITPFIKMDTSATSEPKKLMYNAGGINTSACICVYDENKLPLNFFTAASLNRTLDSNDIADAKYFRASFKLSELNSCYVKDIDGNYLWPIQNRVGELSIGNKNELSYLNSIVNSDIYGIIKDKSIENTTGNEVSDSGYAISPYIPISLIDKGVLWFYGGFTGTNVRCLALYDNNKDFIRGTTFSPNANPRLLVWNNVSSYASSAVFVRFTFKMDATEAYLKYDDVTLFRWDKNLYYKNTLNVVTEYDSSQTYTPNDVLGAGAVSGITNSKNLVGDVILDYTNWSDGSIVPYANFCISPYIPCKKGDVIEFSAGVVNNSPHFLNIYDKEFNYLDKYAPNANPRTFTLNNNSVAYIRFAFKKSVDSPTGSYLKVNDVTMFAWNGTNMITEAKDAINASTLSLNGFNSVFNQNNISDKSAEFCALLNETKDVEKFIFMTDPHLMPIDVWFDSANNPNPYLPEARFVESVSLMQKYYNTCGVDFMMCGGDWLNSNDTQAMACRKLSYITGSMKNAFKKYYPMLGNHDTNYQGVISSDDSSNGELTQDTLRNLMFQDFGKSYYQFNGAHTTYYILDTGKDGRTTMSTYDWEQVAWLGDKLSSNNNEHIIIGMHIYVDSTNLCPLANNIQELVNAFNARESVTLNSITYNFSSVTTGKIHCIICGHTHSDYVRVTEGVPVWCTTNLMHATSLNTFDMMLVNYGDSNNDYIRSVRVGTGKSRILHLTSIEISSGSTETLQTEIENAEWSIEGSGNSVSAGVVTAGTTTGYYLATAEGSNVVEYYSIHIV